MNKVAALISFFLAQTILFGQAKLETDTEQRLYDHVAILASDEMQGRETGTKYELMAADYIIKQLKDFDIQPAGNKNSFLQPFEVLAGKNYGENNSLSVSKKQYQVKSDFYPLEYSGNAKATGKLIYVGYGIASTNPKLNDYQKIKNAEGKIFIMEAGLPKFDNPHAEEGKFADLRHKISYAESKGAVGVIVINTSNSTHDPIPDYTRKLKTSSIPVVFLKNGGALAKVKNETASISVDLVPDQRTAHNVIGFDDNSAETTVVIGAHYDHLGRGHFGSRHTGHDHPVHNGADDNASGVAILLELAREFQEPGHEAYNYLYIAFSGEEMGLLGSSFFVKNPTIDLDKVDYMLNLDMVGRMKNRTLIVNGTGTSPHWGNLLVRANPKNWALNVTANQSGTGPSDHTSFYQKDLPVLAFFSGVHKDYHTPADDIHTLNYKGMAQILDFVHGIVDHSTDYANNFEFTRTKENKQTKKRRFNVTLGVMPNYGFSGEGMMIDGVTEGKAAEIAGIKAEDVIIQMGAIKVNDIYDYMDALEKYSPGDEIEVNVIRGKETVSTQVKFD